LEGRSALGPQRNVSRWPNRFANIEILRVAHGGDDFPRPAVLNKMASHRILSGKQLACQKFVDDREIRLFAQITPCKVTCSEIAAVEQRHADGLKKSRRDFQHLRVDCFLLARKSDTRRPAIAIQ